MNRFFLPAALLTGLSLTLSFKKDSLQVPVNESFKLAEIQYKNLTATDAEVSLFPKTTNPDGSLKCTKLREWTSGFWPGSLWYMYEYTQHQKWKDAAEKWTRSLQENENNTTTHDLGFMMYCSYGNAYRLTGNEAYKPVLIQSAKSLASRFNQKAGCIESWDEREAWDKTYWDFPVIIDNMMNLELLFFASKVTQDPYYYNIAVTHAATTLKNHLRPDFSSYHVVDYDTATGAVLHKQTFQGFSDNSTWARGQAWGIYGFTMVYRETKEQRFLEAARKMADFYLNNKSLPADMVPYWDFNVGQQGYNPDWSYLPAERNYKIRDASAAAVTSAALFELSGYVTGKERLRYKEAAIRMLQSLTAEPYRAGANTNNGFLLKHSVGSFPHGAEIDVPLIYADYYYLEALLRYKNLK